MQTIIFIKLKKSVKVNKNKICIGDIAAIECNDNGKKKKIENIQVYEFSDATSNCHCIGILQIIQWIQTVDSNISIQCLGAVDCVVYHEKKENKISKAAKVIFVSMVSFFGTAFTIMAFHNDIGITSIFDQIQRIVTGYDQGGVNILEISYSLGLGLGIIIFFNHIGKKRITKQPTPIEVSMCTYENDVDQTIVEEFRKKGI